MHRRVFIKKGAMASASLLVASSLIQCTDKSILLDNLIGAPDDIFSSYAKEGNEHFAYYVIPKSGFEHLFFKGEEVFIFSQNGKIVGYTIKSNDLENIKSSIEYLDNIYGTKILAYENDFGKEYEWKTNAKKITLSFTNESQNIRQHCFFSEAMLNNSLLVF